MFGIPVPAVPLQLDSLYLSNLHSTIAICLSAAGIVLPLILRLKNKEKNKRKLNNKKGQATKRMAAEWKAYTGCKVAKVFPGHGDEPFKGKVEKVDPRDKKRPFYILYEDDDAEWVSFEELQKIVIDRPATEGPSAPAAAVGGQAKAQSGGSKKKRSRGQKSAEPAPAAAATPGKKQKASSSAGAAAGDAAGTSADAAAAKGFDAEKTKRDMKTQADAAQGMTQFTFTVGAAQRAAAAAGGKDAADAPAAADDVAAAAGGSGKATPATASRQGASKPAPAAAPSPAAQLPELLTEINRTAYTTAQQLTQNRQAVRLPYKGAGATMLPAMSQAVIVMGQILMCLYSTRRGGSHTPGRTMFDGPPDYQAETEGLLTDLDRLLKHAYSSKTMLLQVKVTLRHMTDGLPGFKAAWDAWVDRAALPVLALCEGAGPFNSSNITLEATALSDEHRME